ncbi:hypothetical protein Hanom_Chr14g01284921 [Helianthus anomalus]
MNQTMPVTFILLLLGVVCGCAGKFCIDTLGGSGAHWLLFWEILCLVHLFASLCTSMLFLILHGPVTVVDQSMTRMLFPYWLRRVVFYVALFLLPLLCGLAPFAGVGEWLKHFVSLVVGRLLWSELDQLLMIIGRCVLLSECFVFVIFDLFYFVASSMHVVMT